MGRNRKNPKDAWLPPGVYPHTSSYVFRPKGTKITITLCKLDSPKHEVIKRWEAEKAKLDRPTNTLQELADKFFVSPVFLDLGSTTQADYQERNAPKLLAVFGKMDRDKIRPEHIRRYMDKRGVRSKVQANREKAFLSRLYQWGYERGLVTSNPCKGVRKFKEESRTRYITDEEYAAVFNHACPVVQKGMEISYCCALRKGDVLTMAPAQVRAEGIYVKQAKNKTEQIREWSPRLRDVMAINLPGIASTTRVIHNKRGQPVTGDSFSKLWAKARKAAMEAHPELEFDFTFHDIKARAISDWEGNKQDFGGLKSASMVPVYDRKTKRVESH